MRETEDTRKLLKRVYPFGIADHLSDGVWVVGIVLLLLHWWLGLAVLLVGLPVLHWWSIGELRLARALEPPTCGQNPSPYSTAPSTTLAGHGAFHRDDRVAHVSPRQARDGQRIIEFPTDVSLGTVYTRPPQDIWRGSDDRWTHQAGDVRGRLSVAEGEQVRLWASQRLAHGEYRSPTLLAPLRDFEPDAFESLFVGKPVTEQLQYITHLTGLRELILGWTQDDVLLGVPSLGSLSQLRGFHVTYTRVTDRSIEPLVRRFKNLRYLYLSGTEISDQTLRAAAKLENLTDLRAAKTNITDDGLRGVAELSGLTEIDLSETRITDAGLNHLRALPLLQRLSLRGTRISDKGFTFLSQLTELRVLDLAGTDVTGSAIANAPLTELVSLSLYDTALTESALEAIGRLPRLRSLSLSRAELTRGATRHLRGMPELRRLAIPDTGITPAELLELLESLPELTELWVDGTLAQSVIRDVKERLRKAPPGAVHLRRNEQPPTETRELPWSGTWEQVALPASAGKGDIRGISGHPSGRPWVASFGPFLQEAADGPSWLKKDWTPPRDAPCVLEMATAIAIGPDGSRYVAHDRELWECTDNEWRLLIGQAPGTLDDIAVGPDGAVWAIRSTRLLYSVKDGTMRGHHLEFLRGELNSVAVSEDGAVWVGSTEGLTTYNDGDWHTWKGSADGLPVLTAPGIDDFAWEKRDVTPIRSVATDPRSNTVWVAGAGGIARFADGAFEVVATPADLPPFFGAVTVDSGGRLFAIGGRRLATFIHGTWRVAEVPNRLLEDGPGHFRGYLQAIYVGVDGIWVGANTGALLRFTPEDWDSRVSVNAATGLG
jgi:hypothetical protein